ncbi:hypothetical protein ACHAXR_000291 [Thalassiosira sp. AJA248-18]
MIVDGDGGSVYVRGLDPLSPVRDQIQVKDIIIAIDDEDTQQMSPVEVGNLMRRKKMNVERKISILRESDLFMGCGFSHSDSDSSGNTSTMSESS